MLDAIAGADPADPTALRAASPNCVGALGLGARGVRVGVDEAYATDGVEAAVAEAFGNDVRRLASGGVEPAVAQAFHNDVRRLAAAGAAIFRVEVPSTDALLSSWAVLCAAEALVHHRGLYPERAASFGPTFRSFLEWGSKLSGADVAAASLAREEWNARFAVLLEDVDMIACPSMPFLPLPVAALAPQARYEPTIMSIIRFTGPFNFSGSPTLSLPSGFTSDGLPLSLQLVGRHRDEATLCRVGDAFEAAGSRARRRPPGA
jgi:amidase